MMFDYFSILFLIVAISITAACGPIIANQKHRDNPKMMALGYLWLYFWSCGFLFVFGNLGLFDFYMRIGQ